MKTSVIIVVGLVVAASSAGTVASDAQEPTSGYGVYGHGAASCGTWTAERRGQTGLDNSIWVEGFVTGVGSTGVRIRRTDKAGMEQWIDQFCANHPLNDGCSGRAHAGAPMTTVVLEALCPNQGRCPVKE